jgi:xanthine dehydrogenase YagS FAD-binding subunit
MASAAASQAEFRAAGTDLSERRRSGVSRGPLIDLVRPSGTPDIEWHAGGAVRISAFCSIAAIAADPKLGAAYPALVAAAGGVATPQVRHVATLGGNLAQHSRCWYYRDPQIACLKKGGAACPAREGNHLYGVAFDLGPCVAPHASTMAAALMAYEATVKTNLRERVTIEQLLGDGSSGVSDNTLGQGEIIESVELGVPTANERALYRRAISRSYAEWPLVEVVIRPCRHREWNVQACPHRVRRDRSCSASASGRRIRSAGSRCERGDHRQDGGAIDAGCKTAGHDRLQARPAARTCTGLARADFRVMHDPEKCAAVFLATRNTFARRSCSIRELKRDDDSTKYRRAVAAASWITA